jgi:hypothetical protein
MSYTLSTESPTLDIIGLLAYIGGTLGLFLGISVLTFVEFVEIGLAFIFHVVKNVVNFLLFIVVVIFFKLTESKILIIFCFFLEKVFFYLQKFSLYTLYK